MKNFERCIEIILAEEGGLVENPKDPGGLTKYGISARAYPHINIRGLTRDDAKAIYKRDYWTPIKGDDLPDGLDLLLLDCAVNQGTGTAIKLLQEAVKEKTDGVLGVLTMDAAKRNPSRAIAEFCALRAWRYEINRNEETFGKGWFRRLFRVFTLAWALKQSGVST